jgi:hypothetical protein
MDKGFDAGTDAGIAGGPADAKLKAWVKPATNKADVATITAGAAVTTNKGDSVSSCAS